MRTKVKDNNIYIVSFVILFHKLFVHNERQVNLGKECNRGNLMLQC